jgi:hypothetical protein
MRGMRRGLGSFVGRRIKAKDSTQSSQRKGGDGNGFYRRDAEDAEKGDGVARVRWQSERLPGSMKVNRPLHNQHPALLFGAEGVHNVDAGCAGCWQHGGYYCCG